jgi:prepilin-type N-terminal cleavage/methylation domain-containing protein
MSARTRGFTLMEVLLATAIAGVALVATTGAMSSAAVSKAELASQPAIAAALAREIATLAETLPRTPGGVTGVTSGADVLALDALHGAVFSPPILADRTAVDTLTEWEQRVTVELFALDDLDEPTGEDVSVEVSGQSQRLYRLTVSVRRLGEVEATVRCWCRP